MAGLRERTMSAITGALDASSKEQSIRPSPKEDMTRYPKSSWDLRTLIIVFPPPSPFRYLNLNTTLGYMGLPIIDRPDNLGSIKRSDAFDLQFCLDAGDKTATFKDTFSISAKMDLGPEKSEKGEISYSLEDKLRVKGMWPDYQIEYRQEDEDLELNVKLVAADNFRRWAHLPGTYCHYTTFCNYQGRIAWGGKKENISGVCLFDHGYGRKMPSLLSRVSKPMTLFRYEVLQLGDKGHMICMDTTAFFNLPLRRTGLVSDEPGRPINHISGYSEEVLEWLDKENALGEPKRVPGTWRGVLEGSGGRFEFEARMVTEPQPVIGPGFLYGFDYRGTWAPKDGKEQDVSGRGYAEETRP